MLDAGSWVRSHRDELHVSSPMAASSDLRLSPKLVGFLEESREKFCFRNVGDARDPSESSEPLASIAPGFGASSLGAHKLKQVC